MFSFAFISLAPAHILTLAFHDQASSIDASYRGNQQWENQIILSKDFSGFCRRRDCFTQRIMNITQNSKISQSYLPIELTLAVSEPYLHWNAKVNDVKLCCRGSQNRSTWPDPQLDPRCMHRWKSKQRKASLAHLFQLLCDIPSLLFQFSRKHFKMSFLSQKTRKDECVYKLSSGKEMKFASYISWSNFIRPQNFTQRVLHLQNKRH